MHWFGLILVLVLSGQCKCEKNEAEDQTNELAPRAEFSKDPLKVLKRRKHFRFCPPGSQRPICSFLQQLFHPDIPYGPRPPTPVVPSPPNVPSSPNVPNNFIIPGKTPECVNCPGPYCNCQQIFIPPDAFPWEWLAGQGGESVQLPNIFNITCYLNEIGLLPSLPITISCWIARNNSTIINILKEIYRIIRDIFKLFPLGNRLFPDEVSLQQMINSQNPKNPSSLNVPNRPGFLNIPFILNRTLPFLFQTFSENFKTPPLQKA